MNEQTAQIEQNIPIEQVKQVKSRLRYCLWAAGGFLFFALGMAGVVLPILPTTPFILVAAFCFARTKRSMTLRAKLTILVPVTVLLAVSFAMMSNIPVGRAIVAAVWVGHIVYFGFIVKSER